MTELVGSERNGGTAVIVFEVLNVMLNLPGFEKV